MSSVTKKNTEKLKDYSFPKRQILKDFSLKCGDNTSYIIDAINPESI